MIVRNSDSICVYGDGWDLSKGYAHNPAKKISDKKATTETHTLYNLPEPEKFIGGRFKLELGAIIETADLALEILNQHKQDAIKEITSIRIKRAFSGVPFSVNGIAYLFGKDSDDITAIKVNTLDIKAGPLTFQEVTGGFWRTIDNANVAMTESQYLSMSDTLTRFLNSNARQQITAKENIIALPSTAVKGDVDAIVDNYRNFDPLA